MHGRGGATSAQAARHGPSSFEARPRRSAIADLRIDNADLG
jgi:hypothetical protein